MWQFKLETVPDSSNNSSISIPFFYEMVDSDDDGDVMAATPVDIKIHANSYAFVIDMPGLKTADVGFQVKPNNVLIISGERRRVEEEGVKYAKMERRLGKMMRKFALPEDANMDKNKITAVCRAGVLTVTVERRPKMIEEKREALRSCGDERKFGAVDRISLLPDELLLCVLSLLSFKEATATSVLSRRWRNLHTFTEKLDFDGAELLRKGRKKKFKGFDEVRQKFLRWVDDVVRLNRSSRLEKFRVLFNLRGSDAQHVEEWVRFALSRKVESLELMSTWEGIRIFDADTYTLNLAPSDLHNLKLLKRVSTYSVNVSGEAVEMLLRNCPLLEHVSVGDSNDLLGLDIIKPFPSFKSLEIIMCDNLTRVVVRDSNIVSLKFKGDRVDFVLQNVPLLSELWTDWMAPGSTEDVVEMFSTVLPQLHVFKIRFMLSGSEPEDVREFCSRLPFAVKMGNLKQLVVTIVPSFCHDDVDTLLLPLIALVRASPRLQRFVIEETYHKICAYKFVEGEVTEISRKFPRAYPHLKEVEFVGYRGVRNQVRILKHFVKNGVALETIVVDPWGLKEPVDDSWDRIPRRKFNAKVFASAKAFKDSVPFGINVKIL